MKLEVWNRGDDVYSGDYPFRKDEYDSLITYGNVQIGNTLFKIHANQNFFSKPISDSLNSPVATVKMETK